MCKYLYLKQVIMICVGLLSCCLMLALITFYPFDNTFFQSSGDVVFNNIFGRLGALSSDILFFIFGCMAYIFPCIIFFITWSCLLKRRQFNFFDLSFKIIGGIVILFSFCGLIDFFLDDFYYCFSGGIIGYLLRTKIFYLYSDVITNIIFLFFLFLGIILLFGFLWLIRVVDIISIFLNFLFFNSISFISILQSNKYFRLLILYLQGIFFRNIKFRLINRYFIQSKIIYFKCIRDVKRQFYNFFKKTYNYINIQLKYQCKLLNYKKFPILQYKTILNNQIAKNIVLTMEHETCKPAINGSLYISEKKKLLFRNSVLNALPSLDLLSIPVFKKMTGNIENTIQKSKLLELTLLNYHVLAKVVNVLQGPVVTRFELDLAPGVRSSRISHLSRDLARSLSVSHVRVVEVLPGKSYVGLEVPNKEREIVYLRDVLESDKFQLSCNCLTLGFGKDISGNVMIANLGDMPHLLIAGATGSGKSIGINNIIVSILYKARSEDVRFIMIDPKILELSVYEGIPHLLKNVITDMKDAIDVLNWCIREMERRYKIIASYGVRHLKSYNEQVELHCINKKNLTDNSIVNNSLIDNQVKNDSLILKKLPYIVIIIDEFSDLILSVGKQAELLIVRLSQKARACGMHLILATQRPSVNVITGLIKANIPSRIAFTVSSKIDSYTILDQSGAESLLGKGDMFYLPPYSSIPIRVHGAFISDEEVASVVKYWKNDVI